MNGPSLSLFSNLSKLNFSIRKSYLRSSERIFPSVFFRHPREPSITIERNRTEHSSCLLVQVKSSEVKSSPSFLFCTYCFLLANALLLSIFSLRMTTMDPEFNEKLVPNYGSPPGHVVHRNAFSKLIFQIRLLMWKRYVESTKSKWDLIKVLFPPVLFFVLMILAYSVFNIFADGGIEPFIVPFAFWIFMQRLVVQIMYEKSSKLQESMRMMGLSDVAYWISYFITDGVILGFVLSFLCTIFTVGGLFDGANFGTILGLFYVFCLAAVPFCFFVCSFFDTPQTSGQALLALLFGKYKIYCLFVLLFVFGLIGNVFLVFRSFCGLCGDFPCGHLYHFSINCSDLMLLCTTFSFANWLWCFLEII